jgi:hypothetical protein
MNFGDRKMTSKEYELFTKYDFERRLKKSFGKQIILKHLEKLTSPDGTVHEVDLNYEFEIDGINYINIIECKYWNSKVTREQVKSFKSVREDLRAHKAIIVTNYGFQSGAIEFAKKHGIGLIKLTRKTREVWAHFDGGLSTIESMFESESGSVNLQIGDELDLVGLFYPNDEGLAKYLVQKFGKEFALLLLDENPKDFDWDDMTTPLPEYIIGAVAKINDNWYQDYNLIETAGLNFRLENEGFFRLFDMKISMLKMHVEMRKNKS